MRKRENSLLFILLIAFFVLLESCNHESSFTTDKWNERDDILYPQRVRIVNDLIVNHLNKNMCYAEILKILGSPLVLENQEFNHIYFEIETRYDSNIDPKWIKVLDIKLNQDSCYVTAIVRKLN